MRRKMKIFIIISIAAISLFHNCKSTEFSRTTNLKYCKSFRLQQMQDLLMVRDCDVIEGNFIIAFNKTNSERDWLKYGGLQVREITGYVIFFLVDHLPSLGLLLPNLRVIRGNTLFSNYALIVYGLFNLKDIMLTNLTSIVRGSVYITNNPGLSYHVLTIDWNKITLWNNSTYTSYPNFIQTVESPIEFCPEKCRILKNSPSLCWSSEDCQNVCPSGLGYDDPFCTSSDYPCPKDCLGGCYKTRFNGKDELKCQACKNFRFLDTCRKSCFPYYEMDDYRCVSAEECVNFLGRKLLNLQSSIPRRLCVVECPSFYRAMFNATTNYSTCIPCRGNGCMKDCYGGVIDTIERVQQYSGCTKIIGSLEINLRGGQVMKELTEHLGQLREVTGYLRISKLKNIVTLSFLSSLSMIHGLELWNNNFSLIVNDNPDLQNLWKISDKTLKIRRGRVMFFSNPKLCQRKIEDLVSKSTWRESVPDPHLRAILNGNKKACNIDFSFEYSLHPLRTKGEIMVSINKSQVNHYVLKYHLTGFYIYYQKSVEEDLDYFPNNKRQWTRVFYKHILDANDLFEIVVSNLEPGLKYGVYLESHMTNSEENFQSSIQYIVTSPFNPGVPRDITVSSRGEGYIEVSWSPPLHIYGTIDHYIVLVEPQETDLEIWDSTRGLPDICDRNVRQELIEQSDLQEKYRKYNQDMHNGQYDSPDENESEDSFNQPSCSNQDDEADFAEKTKLEKLSVIEDLSRLLFIMEPSTSLHHSRQKRNILDKQALDDNCGDSNEDVKNTRRKRETKVDKLTRVLRPPIASDEVNGRTESNAGEVGKEKRVDKSTENIVGHTNDEKPVENMTEYFSSMQNKLIEYSSSLSLHELIPYLSKPQLSRRCIFYMLLLTEQLLTQRETTKLYYVGNCSAVFKESNHQQFCRHTSNSVKEKIVYGTKFNLTNLGHTSYRISIKACQRPEKSSTSCGNSEACKLCSLWFLSRKVYTIDKGFLGISVKINDVTGNKVNFSVVSNNDKNVRSVLGYDVYVRKMSHEVESKNETIRETRFCLRSLKNECASFQVTSTGNYSLEVSPFSLLAGNLGRTSPAYFSVHTVPEASLRNTMSNKYLILVLLIASLLVIGGIFTVLKIFKQKRTEKIFQQMESVFNTEYVASRECIDDCYPSWRSQLMEKIKPQFIHSRKDLCLLGLMDEGKFGIVSRATLMVANGVISVAVKKVKPCNSDDLAHQGFLINEAALMLEFQSHHLVRAFGVVTSDVELYLVMELMHYGSLSKYLKNHRKGDNIFDIFTEQQVMKLGVQIADGMAYLHHNKVLHMDLAARNCLLDGNLNVKVSDFGMSRIVEGEYYTFKSNKPVPYRWMPPENFNYDKFTTHSDVWSYGILLWEVINPGKLPYENLEGIEMVKNKVATGYTLSSEIPSWVPSHFAALVVTCWHLQPKDRPDFLKIVTDLLRYTDDNFKREFRAKSFYYRREMDDQRDYFSVSSADLNLRSIANNITEDKITSQTPLTSYASTSYSLPRIKKSNFPLTSEELSPRYTELRVKNWNNIFRSLKSISFNMASTPKPTAPENEFDGSEKASYRLNNDSKFPGRSTTVTQSCEIVKKNNNKSDSKFQFSKYSFSNLQLPSEYILNTGSMKNFESHNFEDSVKCYDNTRLNLENNLASIKLT